MDAQQEHDYLLERRGKRRVPKKSAVEALLRSKNGPTLEPPPPGGGDPVARLVAANPGLTEEEVVKMAEAYGF
jgi:hypothetical protein